MQPVNVDVPQKPLPGMTGFRVDLRVATHFELDNGAMYENSGKIILPPVILQELMDKSIFMSPQSFKLSNKRYPEIFVYAIAQEYIGLPGRVYMPTWMMETLGVSFGDLVHLESSRPLEIGVYTKVQATSPEFLNIPNHKEALEIVLSEFGCLTESSTIRFTYDAKVYELRILKTLPARAVSLIDANIAIDFERPIGYVTPPKERKKERTWTVVDKSKESEKKVLEDPFAGNARWLTGGKQATKRVVEPPQKRVEEPSPVAPKPAAPAEKLMKIPFGGKPKKLE